MLLRRDCDIPPMAAGFRRKSCREKNCAQASPGQVGYELIRPLRYLYSMKKTSLHRSGIMNPRVLFAVALGFIGSSLGWLSIASTPSSGMITDISGPQMYTAGPFYQANQSPVGLGQLDTGPRCSTGFPCDQYTLHVQLPADYGLTHCFPTIKVTMTWTDTGTGQSDYDLYIYDGTNPTIDGNHSAQYQSASGANPEVAIIAPLQADGNVHDYTVVIVPFQPTGETVNVKAELLPGPAPGSPACGTPGFGGPDSTAPGVPRFQIFEAPSPDADVGNGEFNIGFNPHTGRIMTMNSGPVWRITPPEIQNPAKPECCEGLWEDRSAATTNIGLDPILWTDQLTGRTFVSNSTAGANAVYAYSDSDGEPSMTQPTGWTEFGVGGPNGGADHETIGSGPYPALLSALTTPLNQGHPVYYCSQDIVGPAACYRSDDQGMSWGAGTLAYNGQGTGTPGGTDCGGLHGHVHVAPDGTVWLPVNQCTGQQGGVFSTNGGITWTEFKVPGAISQQEGADPSIAIDANSTIYYAYVNNEPVANPANDPPEGHARVAVGNRNGNAITWTQFSNTGDPVKDYSIDIGATHTVRNAAEIEAVGGSANRAAVGFLGTDRPGDYQAISFPGKWYPFIATTYDGGHTWTTVNATPNDPVQSQTGIWQQGGGATQRNLLDFNEITIDDKGRVLYGYSDGCVTAGCIAGTAPNDYVAYMRVARQSGGKTLLASYDGNTDTTAALTPKPPCLSGTRDNTGSHLTWKVPDNGGSPITQYQIFRGTTSGGEDATPIGYSATNKFDDTSADPNVADYFYTVKAVNNVNTGNASNEIDLAIDLTPPQTACALPGLTILQDPSNDELDMVPAHDVQSISLGEPFAFASDKIVFTMKVQDLSTLPADTEWPITFDAPDGHNYTVQMTTSPVDGATTLSPLFQVFDSTGSGLGAPTADPASNYTPDGTITIVVPRSLIGNPSVGTQLNHFLVRIAANLVGITITPDNMPDNVNAPAGTYAIVGNAACAPNTAPVANLVAHVHGTVNPPQGDPPLTIDFDASASSDADNGDAVASYHFDFGDGTSATCPGDAACTGSGTAQHTYTTNGDFGAQLKVTDSRGKVSDNTGLVNVEVETPLNRVVSEKVHGQKGPFDFILYDRSVFPNGDGQIECRKEGNGYDIIYTFGSGSEFTVTGDANIAPTITNGGTVASHGHGPGANQYQVHLTGVTNAQHHVVTLNGIPVHNNAINGSAGDATLNNVAVRFDLLQGDVNGDGFVLSGDYTATRNKSGATVDGTTFQYDINADGFILSGDYTAVRSKSGTKLP